MNAAMAELAALDRTADTDRALEIHVVVAARIRKD